MQLFSGMINLQLTLFILISVGFALKKFHVVSDAGQGVMSSLIINLILPCNIIHAFVGELGVTADLVRNCVLAVIISLVIQFLCIFGGPLLFRRWPRKQRNVMEFGIICSNSSFVGLPIAESLYGSLGVLYTSIFQIPQRVTMWTSGLALFTEVSRKDAFVKVIRHPCIVSIFIGFFFMVAPVDMPYLADNTITMISRCTVPMSMLTIGCVLAGANLKTTFSPTVLYHTLWRLILCPLIAYLILLPFPVDTTLRAVVVIMTAMPVGSTTTLLAERYHCDAPFATQITFVSTLFSIITIPMWGMILGGA